MTADRSTEIGSFALAKHLLAGSNQYEPPMFDSIVAKITNTVRYVVKAVGAATRNSPWLAPVAILAFFFVL